jgi:hypothetical protein
MIHRIVNAGVVLTVIGLLLTYLTATYAVLSDIEIEFEDDLG